VLDADRLHFFAGRAEGSGIFLPFGAGI